MKTDKERELELLVLEYRVKMLLIQRDMLQSLRDGLVEANRKTLADLKKIDEESERKFEEYVRSDPILSFFRWIGVI